ncbi:hypothetical protein Tco_0045609 [Tanacetum coccineum]
MAGGVETPSPATRDSGILWKLILLFPDLKVMVPLSNLITALAVVKNGVPKMKGLFSSSFISMIRKSTGILISEFAADGAVKFALKMKGDMIIKNLNLKPMIDAIMRDFWTNPSRWKELSKETSSKILPCGDGSCWKAFKPIARL